MVCDEGASEDLQFLEEHMNAFNFATTGIYDARLQKDRSVDAQLPGTRFLSQTRVRRGGRVLGLPEGPPFDLSRKDSLVSGRSHDQSVDAPSRGDGNSELDALFVEPDLWKQGLGRFLIEHCAGH
jgi:hypothetical protein